MTAATIPMTPSPYALDAHEHAAHERRALVRSGTLSARLLTVLQSDAGTWLPTPYLELVTHANKARVIAHLRKLERHGLVEQSRMLRRRERPGARPLLWRAV